MKYGEKEISVQDLGEWESVLCVHVLHSLLDFFQSRGHEISRESCGILVFFLAQLAENSHKVHLTRRNLVL